ncbi:unnamed protein product, partial [Laminaria digitata]
MYYAGHPIDLASACHNEMPNYVDRLRIVANDPVAAATFFQETLQAVFDCLLRVGAKDGDGGVLGKVKSYIGMTEEQFRLTLHAHLLVWVYGYSSPEHLRDDPILERAWNATWNSQGMSSASTFLDQQIRKGIQMSFSETIEQVPSSIASISEDASTLAVASNRHRCMKTCEKYAKRGADGNEVVRAQASRESVQLPLDDHNEDDDFSVEVRRGSSHINSYNWAIQQWIRSNMDIKPILGTADARGLVMYILMYSTKATQTVSTLLPLLAEVLSRVQRLQSVEGTVTSSQERARKLVKPSFGKVLSGTELGGPAAVCVIMGWSDSLKSHTATYCPVWPVF